MKARSKTEMAKLRRLEARSQQIRERLGICGPGEVIYQAPQSRWSENDVVVEANGLGGAKMLIVEGNYPIDYSIKSQRLFETEDGACEAADKIASRHA